MKPGKKTTEFWMVLGGTIVSSAIAIFVAAQFLTPEQGEAIVSTASEVIKAVVALITVLVPIIGPIFYSNGRAKVKAATNGK